MARYPLRLLLGLLLLGALAPGAARSADEAPDPPVGPVAILPFADHTGTADAAPILMSLLERALVGRRHHIVSNATLRPLLRAHRIRSNGRIGRRGTGIVVAETGARYLLLGSWDVYRVDGYPEVGVSLRLLDARTLVLAAAVSLGRTGRERTGLLDGALPGDVEEVALRTVSDAVDALFAALATGPAAGPDAGCARLAVIPLDDYADTAFAGGIVTNILLSRLLAAGYFVVEPGFVRELGLSREVVNRGGVDRDSARALADSLGACQIVTGAVQRFETARGPATSSVPRFAAGFRVADCLTGNLILMREFETDGGDGDSVFQLGREHTVTGLVAGIADKFIASMRKANRKESTHGSNQP